MIRFNILVNTPIEKFSIERFASELHLAVERFIKNNKDREGEPVKFIIKADNPNMFCTDAVRNIIDRKNKRYFLESKLPISFEQDFPKGSKFSKIPYALNE